MDDSGGTLSNEPIDVEGLPRLRDDSFVPVDPRHVIGTVATQIVVAVAVVAVGIVSNGRTDGPVVLLISLAVGILLLLSAVVSVLAARRMSYQVREHDLSLRSGLITRTESTVPYRRVQHVYLSRGLLERGLGLASLSINSAGPDISVPGLPVDVATTLRGWIVERADLDAEHAAGPAEPTTDPVVADEPPWAPPAP